MQHVSEQLEPGSDGWKIVDELQPAQDEPLIAKSYGDAFEQTALEETLAGLAVGRLLITGAQTDQCVRGTLHGALVRGYDTILVSDAHTTEDATSWGAPSAAGRDRRTRTSTGPTRMHPAASRVPSPPTEVEFGG